MISDCKCVVKSTYRHDSSIPHVYFACVQTYDSTGSLGETTADTWITCGQTLKQRIISIKDYLFGLVSQLIGGCTRGTSAPRARTLHLVMLPLWSLNHPIICFNVRYPLKGVQLSFEPSLNCAWLLHGYLRRLYCLRPRGVLCVVMDVYKP